MTRLAQQHAAVSSDVVDGRTEVITLDGEFDLSNAPQVEERLGEALAAEEGQVLVDLRGVRFLDSTMLQVLIRGMSEAAQTGTGFGLIRPHPRLWRVFVLTGLSERFPTYGSIQEALSES